MSLQTPVSDHEAFCDGLFRGCQKTLVEPDSVRAGHFVQTVSDLGGVETAAQHLRSQHADAAADRAGGEDFGNHFFIVIDSDVEVLAVERNAPGRAAQFPRALETNRALLASGSFGFGETTRSSLVLRLCSALWNDLRGWRLEAGGWAGFNDRCGCHHSWRFSFCFCSHRRQHLIL